MSPNSDILWGSSSEKIGAAAALARMANFRWREALAIGAADDGIGRLLVVVGKGEFRLVPPQPTPLHSTPQTNDQVDQSGRVFLIDGAWIEYFLTSTRLLRRKCDIPSKPDITQVLAAVEQGERSSERLLPLVYEELRKLAYARMSHERGDHTLQATALVHEAWLRLAGTNDPQWDNRAHFFAAAAEAMRRVLIDHGRGKQAAKRGGGWERVGLELIDRPSEASDDLLLQVSEAVDALADEDPSAAEFVKLRFFAGLTVDEASLALGVTDRTGRRYWRFARAWLYDWFEREGEPSSS